MNIISLIVGSLAGSARALEYADLAPCGQVCINNMFNQACSMNCPPYPDGRPNLECLCKDANFLNGIHDCAFGACLTQDAETTLGLAAMYCTDPKYTSPNCPCSDPNPLLQPGASPAAVVAPDPGVDSSSGSSSSADKDDSLNPSDSTNSNSNSNSADGATPNGNNSNNSNNPRVDDIPTYVSNENTTVATVTANPATNDNGVVSSDSAGREGGGGGLRTVTAHVAPKITGLGNTAAAAAAAGGGATSKTDKVDHGNASTPTSATLGAEETNGTGARDMWGLQGRMLVAVGLGFVLFL